MLELLGHKVASPAQMSRELGTSVSDVAYHVKVLQECKFIRLVKTRPVRGAVEHFYTARGISAFDSYSLLSVPPALRGEVAMIALDHLTRHLHNALEGDTFDSHAEARLVSASACVDELGWKEIVKTVTSAENALKRAVEGAEQRLRGKPGQTIVFALGLFEAGKGAEKGD
jgi:DNA-binding transcriptional regulator GbsR (MarR family)